MTSRDAALGAGNEATFVAWSDGDTAAVLIGLQGGAMITPTIRVAALPMEGPTVCLRVALHNSVTDASDVSPGLVADVTFVRVGNFFEAANLYDLLAYDAASLRGKTLDLVVDVNGVTFRATSRVSLRLD